MSIPIVYDTTQYVAEQHLFNTTIGNILQPLSATNTFSCNVITIHSTNVGIGTTIPVNFFHVQKPSYFVGYVGLGTTFPLQSLHVQYQSYFVGNIGIGTTLPRRLLHVQGDIYSPVLVGKVAWFAKSSAPTGWLKCNGSTINRSTYANLFTKIGTTFGVGDNVSTFGLPDLQGKFIRSWDNSRGIDTSRGFGTTQTATMLNHTHSGTTNAGEGEHTHTITDPGHTHTYTNHDEERPYQPNQFYALRETRTLNTSVAYTGISINTTNSAHTHTMTTGNPSTGGGTETRPRNVALLPCIKY